MITHHADDATLLSFAAGSLPEALAAVVASHVAMCPRCRKELAVMDRLGGAMLHALPGTPLSISASDPERSGVDTAQGGPHVQAASASTAPLARLLRGSLEDIRWRRLGPGVWHKPLELSKAARGDLRLIRVAPGKAMPDHGHGGSELTLILSGSYTDEIGRFDVGDLADLDDQIEHMPVADRDTGCICLIASDEKARFKGLIARMVQPFIGL